MKLPANIEFLGEVSTTMTVARERIAAMLAAPDAATRVQRPFGIVAESQACGRGTGGRVWTSPKGNMYFTLCVPQNVPSLLNPALAPVLPLVCGLACRRAVLTVLPGVDASHVRTKWPNDIIYQGCKIGGTLVESEADFYVMGMGMNVDCAPAVTDGGRGSTTINQIAADLGLATGTTPALLAAAVWDAFFALAADPTATRAAVVQDFDTVMDRSLQLHRRVAEGRDPEALVAVRLNDWGHLTVRHEDGREETLCADYLF